MNTILDAISSFFEKMKTDSRYFYWFVIGLLVLALIFSSKSCDNAHKEAEEANRKARDAKSNIDALKDTVRQERDKLGRLQFVKLSFVSDIENLKSLNKELYDEVQSIRGQVVSMSKTIISIKGTLEGDTIKGNPNQPLALKDDTLNHNFKFADKGKDWEKTVEGKSVFVIKDKTANTKVFHQYDILTKDRLTMNIKASLVKRESDGKFEYVLSTSYPNANLVPEGFVDPMMFKEYFQKDEDVDRWIIGPYIGAGITNTFSITPQIGIGIMYRIIGF
jgi:hypothetical protein